MRLWRAIAVFASLGIAINIAVAWGCALWCEVHPKRDNSHMRVLPAVDREAAIRALGPFIGKMDGYWPPEPEAILVPTTYHGFGVTESHLVANRTKGRDYFGCFWWAGWPMHSLECWMPAGPANAYEWGLPLPRFARGNFISFPGMPMGGTRPPLPLRPLAFGFVMNSVFYSVLLVAVVYGVRATQVTLRRLRARCLGCGYDLAGNASGVCPECGHAIAGSTIGSPTSPR